MRWLISLLITGLLPILSFVNSPHLLPVKLPINADQVVTLINQVRTNDNLSPLPSGQKTCLMADSALHNQALQPEIIAQKCPECHSVQVARFSQPLDSQWLVDQVTQNASLSAYFLDSDLTHMCVATSASEVVIALVSAQATPTSQQPLVPMDFSEDQLWQALTTYRHSQGRSDLTHDENICQYARKRVQDHISLLAQHVNPSQYPVESKYPLDAHRGFQQDADSGLVFDITQKTEVAENLAYWPNAADPIHVIEWGWDTSTEGHREAQLSNDWTVACLSGQDGFYVAIFAK